MCLTPFPHPCPPAPPFSFVFRYHRFPDDRDVFVQVRASVQVVQSVRTGRARCDGLLFGHRLGSFDRSHLRFEDLRNREFPRPPYAYP